MKKKNTVYSRYRVKKRSGIYSYGDSVDDVKEVENEFARMLTESWEAIYKKPAMHAKAVHTAKKIRELKVLLLTTGQLPQSIH